MVEAGKISIGAELDTQNLDRGVARAKQGLNEVGDSANSVENDLKRTGLGAGALGGKLATAGLVGAGALAGIAARAPATAGAMARIKVATGALTRELGEQLAPTFDAVARGISNLATFAENNPVSVKIGLGAIGAAAGAGLLTKLGVAGGIGSLLAGTGLATAAGAGTGLLGLLIGGAGGVAGGFAGTGAASTGIFGEERGAAPAVVGAAGVGGLAGLGAGALTGAAIGAFGGPIGAGAGAIIGAIVGLIAGGVAEYSKGRKDRESRNEADLN